MPDNDERACANCEYFDRHHGDCLNSLSPRFQTKPDWCCDHWFPDTTEYKDADARRVFLGQS